MTVTFYLITNYGRSKMTARDEDAAMAEAKLHEHRYRSPVQRIVKETKQTIWENTNG